MTPNNNEEDVLDFNAGLLRKLKSDLTDSKQILDDIVKGSRIYWQRVQAVHQSALLLLEAEDLKQAITSLQEDVARLLGMDAIQLYLQRAEGEVVGHCALLLKPVPKAYISMLEQKAFVLREPESAMLLLPSSGPVESAAGIPLTINHQRGMLALGCRGESHFGSGQALEPYIFLARVIERLGKTWLSAKNPA
jgi:uncharacterized protein YigA (DUF484 family)